MRQVGYLIVFFATLLNFSVPAAFAEKVLVGYPSTNVQGVVIINLQDEKMPIYTFDRQYLDKTGEECNALKTGIDSLNNSEFKGETAKDLTFSSKVNGKDNTLPQVLSNNIPKSVIDNMFPTKGPDTKEPKCGNSRVYATKGDQLLVYVIQGKSNADVSFDEAERDTELIHDIKQLIAAIAGEKPEGEARKVTEVMVTRVVYEVQDDRALFTVGMTVKKPEDSKPSKKGTDGATEKKKADSQVTITTGPKEHLYIAADVRLVKAAQLTYDSGTKSFQEKDVPSAFYLSINYMLGDFYATEQLHGLIDNLVFKALFNASAKPYESMGVGIGFRFPELSGLGQTLNQLSPFGGVVWNLDDKVINGTVKTRSNYGSPKIIGGFSYNLDNLYNWLKPKKKNTDNKSSN